MFTFQKGSEVRPFNGKRTFTEVQGLAALTYLVLPGDKRHNADGV